MRAGLITHTHSSGAPLPLPIRVSSGFLVIGLSGKMRIQIFPPRLTWRVMAIRAASIWRAVTQPASIACNPKSPNDTFAPRVATPRRRPRCCFLNLTFFGIIMMRCLLVGVGDRESGAGEKLRHPTPDTRRPESLLRALPRFGFRHLAFENPHLDADDPV